MVKNTLKMQEIMFRSFHYYSSHSYVGEHALDPSCKCRLKKFFPMPLNTSGIPDLGMDNVKAHRYNNYVYIYTCKDILISNYYLIYEF